MNQTAWEAIKRDEARKVPTAPIGLPVQWYINGDRRQIVAAQVQGVEGVGRLKLKVFPLNSMPQEKVGVYHVDHQVHDQPNNPTTYRCGSWDFVPGTPIPKDVYKGHEEDIAKRKTNLLAADEAAKKAEAQFKQKAAELKAGKRKLDILPAPSI